MWTFIQDQVLGMKWLNSLIGALLGLFGIDTESKIGASVRFFIYDTIKITVLLCILIFIISYIQSFLSKGALLGTILSFMMAVTTLSLPSLIMLKKAIKPKLMGVFVAICVVGIVLVGYGFNIFQNLFI